MDDITVKSEWATGCAILEARFIYCNNRIRFNRFNSVLGSRTLAFVMHILVIAGGQAVKRASKRASPTHNMAVRDKGAGAAMKEIEILPVTLLGGAKAAAAVKGFSTIHLCLSHREDSCDL